MSLHSPAAGYGLRPRAFLLHRPIQDQAGYEYPAPDME